MTHTTLPRWSARIVAVLLTIAASSATFVLATPSSALAATQMVQFSTDGLHWSDSYDTQLFRGVALVPGGSATRSFYVRNGANEAALLRVTLAKVGTNDIPLADATRVSSSTAGAPGAMVPVSLAQPCYTLSQGLRLASGDSVRVDNTVSLDDLGGTAGQTGSVWFAIRVSLSSTDVSAPAPDTCPVDYGTIDTFPNPTISTTSTASASGSPAVYHRTAAGWTVGASVGAGTVTTPTTPTTPGEPSTPLAQTLVSNTGRLYQEYDVAFWLAMSVLGAVILVLARRRRAEDQPEEPVTSTQIGNRP
jgi:hypothetical protein